MRGDDAGVGTSGARPFERTLARCTGRAPYRQRARGPWSSRTVSTDGESAQNGCRLAGRVEERSPEGIDAIIGSTSSFGTIMEAGLEAAGTLDAVVGSHGTVAGKATLAVIRD